ncbi:MAG TPA: Smr/MutS family protein [Planctomycetota bacterium]|mgnify:CR=1 FL=1|jgi:DNA-nicking Smr family endonuclease|nr:Smr/MutS family protein [Planctomycetota bacterium]HJP02403.1 Smr/MutS family protein [Planctomycetota bacterium]
MRDQSEPSQAGREIDLHGLRPEQALRSLFSGLQTARVRGWTKVVVITGRGWGNARQEPILRGKVETWLQGQQARRVGVKSFSRQSHGGALDVNLRAPGEAEGA